METDSGGMLEFSWDVSRLHDTEYASPSQSCLKEGKHNSEQSAKIYSESQIKELEHSLTELKQLSENRDLWSHQRWYAGREYSFRQASVQEEIEVNTKEGWDSLQAGNGAIVGSVLTFVFFVKRHLNKHLDFATKRSMGQFEEAVKGHLHQMLDRLEGSMKTPDAQNAITELGPLLECWRKSFHHVTHV